MKKVNPSSTVGMEKIDFVSQRLISLRLTSQKSIRIFPEPKAHAPLAQKCRTWVNRTNLQCSGAVLLALFIMLHSTGNAGDGVGSKPAMKRNQPLQQKVQSRDVQQHGREYSQKPSGNSQTAGDIRSALKRQIWNAQQPPKPNGDRKPSVKKSPPTPQSIQQRNRQLENQKFFRNPRKQMAATGIHTPLKKKYSPAALPPKETKAAAQTQAVSSTPRFSGAESQPATQATVVLVAIAVCIALGGTFAIMFLASRQSVRKVEKIEDNIQDGPVQRTSLLIPVFAANDSAQPKEESLFDFPEEEDNTIELAQRFHRGQGEMKLALNLQARGKEHSPIEKLMHSRSFGKLNGNKKQLAKRFGIGNGEVELALKFRKFQSSQLNESHSRYYQEVV